MKLNRRTVLLFMALAMFSAISVSGFAADMSNTAAGAAEYKLLVGIITGALGKALGLLVTVMGIWLAFVKNEKFGFVLLVLGPIIVGLPTLYNGTRDLVCPITQQLGAPCGVEGSQGQAIGNTQTCTGAGGHC